MKILPNDNAYSKGAHDQWKRISIITHRLIMKIKIQIMGKEKDTGSFTAHNSSFICINRNIKYIW